MTPPDPADEFDPIPLDRWAVPLDEPPAPPAFASTPGD